MVAAVGGGYGSLDADTKARVAFMRFGFGPKPGGRLALGTGENAAYDACLRELNNPRAAIIEDTAITITYGSDTFNPTIENIGRVVGSPGELPRTVFRADAAERYVQFMKPEVGFVERLVQFWQNHFSLYSSKASSWSGHMDRWAIRRNVLGSFGDMLEAVETHPAMIAYLDNGSSFGPNSPHCVYVRKYYAKYGVPTYNENLAREILELHTVGVDGGYTQDDVTAFAKVLTGWHIVPGGKPRQGQFYFNAAAHEPGAFTIMGKTYGQADGLRRGKAVLRDLARHPQTARHIAYKLIHHFITDAPSEEDVTTLANVFKSTNGNLYLVSRALLELPSAWTEPFGRIKQPLVWVISMLRGLGVPEDKVTRDGAWRFDLFLSLMGWGFWSRVTPDGYPDDNSYWLTGDALRVRNDMAFKLLEIRVFNTTRMPASLSAYTPQTLADDLLGRLKTPALRAALDSHSDVRVTLPLIFLSPEYVRS